MIIAKERAEENNAKNGRRAVIDVDCNNVTHLVRHKSIDVVEETEKFHMQWALYGVIVVPI